MKARDDGDVIVVERAADTPGGHVNDVGAAVKLVGNHARLRARVCPRAHAIGVEGHREHRHRDAFARREQHVEFAGGRLRGHFLSEVDEFIGHVPHRRDDDHDFVARLRVQSDARGDALDRGGILNGGSAKFLYDKRHGRASLSRAGLPR